MKRTLKLETKIMMLVMTLVLVAIAILASFATTWTNNNVQARIEDNIRNIAALVSNSEDIAAALTYPRNAFGNETGDMVQPMRILKLKNGVLEGGVADTGPADL